MISKVFQLFQKNSSIILFNPFIKKSFAERVKLDISKIPNLDEFLKQNSKPKKVKIPDPTNLYLNRSNIEQDTPDLPRKFFIETYGCQMNENDTEIISGILQKEGFTMVKNMSEANIVLLNTCAIRENAEAKVWNRLQELRAHKSKTKKQGQLIIGVLGCMAERVKEKLVEKNKAVDIVIGPDAYRDLPQLIRAIEADSSYYGINVQLSYEETYADIVPVRSNPESNSAFISIMRGCNNMCSFCIVPFTRGRERSRPIDSIVDEVKALRDQGVKEITLLGQNVNSYFDNSSESTVEIGHENSKGFGETYKLREGNGPRFDTLLEKCAEVAPEVRFRFTSPHPKDFPERVLEVIKSYGNICKNIHMPAQSGSSSTLKRMRRNYSREAYIELVDHIRGKIPGITISTDMICGFCGETDEEFQETLSLMDYVKYEQAFLFAYSMREKTHAHRNYQDDVPPEIKQARLEQMIENFHKNQHLATQSEVGKYHIVLIDGESRVEGQMKGRTDTNRIVVFSTGSSVFDKLSYDLAEKIRNGNLSQEAFEERIKLLEGSKSHVKKGDLVIMRCDDHTSRTLFCKPIAKTTNSDFFYFTKNQPFFRLKQGNNNQILHHSEYFV